MASATLAGRSGPGLRVGNAISRAFPIWGRLIGPFSLLYALEVLPTIVQSVRPHHVQIHGEAASIFAWPLIAATLLSVLIAFVTHGATYLAVTNVMEGGSPSVMTAVEAAMGRFLPLLGTWLCGGFLMLIGYMLLFVPGLMIYAALFVMGPVCVLERLSPTKSLKRSAELTKGSRWRVFGVMLFLTVLGGMTSAAAIPARATLGLLPSAVIQLLLLIVVGLFGTIVTTIVYRDLAESRDGFGGGRLASVFD